jgi:hypothetical protein
MTRRKFIQKLLKIVLALIVGSSWIVKKAVLPKFVRAVRLEKYPGRLRPLQDISKQDNWSG